MVGYALEGVEEKKGEGQGGVEEEGDDRRGFVLVGDDARCASDDSEARDGGRHETHEMVFERATGTGGRGDRDEANSQVNGEGDAEGGKR